MREERLVAVVHDKPGSGEDYHAAGYARCRQELSELARLLNRLHCLGIRGIRLRHYAGLLRYSLVGIRTLRRYPGILHRSAVRIPLGLRALGECRALHRNARLYRSTRRSSGGLSSLRRTIIGIHKIIDCAGATVIYGGRRSLLGLAYADRGSAGGTEFHTCTKLRTALFTKHNQSPFKYALRRESTIDYRFSITQRMLFVNQNLEFTTSVAEISAKALITLRFVSSMPGWNASAYTQPSTAQSGRQPRRRYCSLSYGNCCRRCQTWKSAHSGA